MINAIVGNGLPEMASTKAADVALPKEAVAASDKARVQTKSRAADSVDISVAAQAKLLKSQGQSINAIASQLGLDVKTVTSYLS